MNLKLKCLVLCVFCCAVSHKVCGIEVSAKASNYGFDFVMKELMKQRVDIEKQSTEMDRQQGEIQKLRVENAEMKEHIDRLSEKVAAKGASYIRWGRTACSGDTTVLYKGYVAGAKYNDKGSGANFLCLHDQPQWSRNVAGVNYFTCSIYGVEYEMYVGQNNVFSFANNGGQQLVDQPTPCAMCYTPTRATTVMIPARTECPAGWIKEYQGYIVSDHQLHQRSEYICWDEAPETALGAGAQNQARIYPVEVMCGSLPCSRYPTGQELTCVVCSK